MFDWIWANRSWLFSGIGILIIAALYKLLKDKIPKRRRAHIESALPAIAASIGMVHNITVSKVVNSIKNAPILQRPEMISGFLGLPIQWKGHLMHLENIKDNRVRLMISVIEEDAGISVFCDVSSAQYPGLKLLKREHPIEVAGIIDSINSYDWMDVRDAKIKFNL